MKGDCSQHLFMVIKELMNEAFPYCSPDFVYIFSYLAKVALPPHPNNMISLHVQPPA